MIKPPNPGSDEAYKKGCTCPRMDNSYGRGYYGQEGIFVMTQGCILHWPTPGSPGEHKKDDQG